MRELNKVEIVQVGVSQYDCDNLTTMLSFQGRCVSRS